MRAVTVSRVRSREWLYTAVESVTTMEPSAAPVTVPAAPKSEPRTALVAAAPAPASTLLIVKLGAFGPAGCAGGTVSCSVGISAGGFETR
jgi:hypothetical protein